MLCHFARHFSLVSPRKTGKCPNMTEKLLTAHKTSTETNKTNKVGAILITVNSKNFARNSIKRCIYYVKNLRLWHDLPTSEKDKCFSHFARVLF